MIHTGRVLAEKKDRAKEGSVFLAKWGEKGAAKGGD